MLDEAVMCVAGALLAGGGGAASWVTNSSSEVEGALCCDLWLVLPRVFDIFVDLVRGG